jgi:hypothetical protein
VIDKGSQQAVAAWWLYPVGQSPKLKEEIQRSRWCGPPKDTENGKLRRCGIRHKQGPVISAKRGDLATPQLVFPKTDLPARPKFNANEADRLWPMPRWRRILGIDAPDFIESGEIVHTAPRNWRRTA